MQIVVLAISSGQQAWLKEATAVYEKKLSAFSKFQLQLLKASKQPREKSNQKVLEEEKKIFQFLNASDKVVLFDEHGKKFNSMDFSKSLQNTIEQSPSRIVYIIGGAFGVSDKVKQRANTSISLSPLVFNHQVALIVALEQIYRAQTIQKNIPYHNP